MGANLLSLDETCLCLPEDNCEYLGVYVVQHELMHAAGFFHEQNRYDRDDYVIVNYTNIQPGIENRTMSNILSQNIFGSL